VTFSDHLGFQKAKHFFGKGSKERLSLPDYIRLLNELQFKEAPNPSLIIWENRKIVSRGRKWLKNTLTIAKLAIWFGVCYAVVLFSSTFIENARYTVFRYNNYCDQINNMFIDSQSDYASWAALDE
jgi:hypothetical protein